MGLVNADISIGEYIRRAAARYPRKAAIIDHDVEYSYAEFHRRTDRLAAALLGLGVERGERVAVLMENAREPLEVFAASMKAGFTHVPLNSRLQGPEIAELIADSGAVALFTDENHAEVVCEVLPKLASVKTIISTGLGVPEALNFESIIGESSEQLDEYADLDSRAFIIYTSGTTGHAKGVTSSQRQMVTESIEAILTEYQIASTSRLLALYPHSSTASTNCAFVPAWIAGATLIVDDVRRFTAERFLSNVERHRVTHATAVPTMLVRILRHVEEHGLSYDVSSLDVLAYGSAPIAPDVTSRLIHYFGSIFVQVYGMTEANGIVSTLRRDEHDPGSDDGRARLRSCGAPLATTRIEVVDENGVRCAPDEPGEIRVQCSYLMLHYWNDPERTAATIRDGWLYTGDVGTFDENGYLYVVDRIKDLIISGGQNIASKEIEDVLYEHPAVMEAAVIGVPDDEWGERVYAFVSLTDTNVTVEELHAKLATRLASFKLPKEIEIRESLPKNSVGKITKGELREPFWAAAAK